MDIQQYITSGILEMYAMGLASPEEVAQLERLLPYHPVLRDALTEFEYQLELHAQDNQIPPPPGLRGMIEDRLRELPAIMRPQQWRGRHTREGGREYLYIKESSTHIRVHKYWRWALVSIFILSKIFLILFLYYFIQYQHNQKEIRALEEQVSKLSRSQQVVPAPPPAGN
jgi:hypothetical protein